MDHRWREISRKNYPPKIEQGCGAGGAKILGTDFYIYIVRGKPIIVQTKWWCIYNNIHNTHSPYTQLYNNIASLFDDTWVQLVPNLCHTVFYYITILHLNLSKTFILSIMVKRFIWLLIPTYTSTILYNNVGRYTIVSEIWSSYFALMRFVRISMQFK